MRPGRAADHSPLLVPRSWKSRAITLPTLRVTPGLKRENLTHLLLVHICQHKVSRHSCKLYLTLIKVILKIVLIYVAHKLFLI